MIHATAVALVHEDDVHARRQAIARYAQHVLRIGRSFEAVNDNQRQRFCTIRPVPVAPAANFDAGRDLDQTLFREGQLDFSGEQEAGNGLHMAAAEPMAWAEWRTGGAYSLTRRAWRSEERRGGQ